MNPGIQIQIDKAVKRAKEDLTLKDKVVEFTARLQGNFCFVALYTKADIFIGVAKKNQKDLACADIAINLAISRAVKSQPLGR